MSGGDGHLNNKKKPVLGFTLRSAAEGGWLRWRPCAAERRNRVGLGESVALQLFENEVVMEIDQIARHEPTAWI